MYVAMTRARRTVTILASEARPSVFIEELMKEPEFGVVVPLDAQKHTHTCPTCGGRLLHMAGKDGRDWYRCEHVKLCGSRMPACPACGRLYPLNTTAEAARELGKDKTAKRVGLVLAVLILVITVLIVVGWLYFSA